MKRTHVNGLIDALAFVAFLFLLSTGMVLLYQLPPGSGGRQGFGTGQVPPSGRYSCFGGALDTSGEISTIGPPWS